ncbi:MAG: PLDc_N domain-containing protein [Coriobacteriia bacterium]|nr:PLDc_N domain-containing protein [Coriobacteriia bacterium]
MNTTFEWSAIPAGLQIGIIALAVVQIAVEIYALVTLFRTPDERLQFGKKWPWVLIILFVNLVGAIVFLVAGRRPEAATDPLAAARAAEAAADEPPAPPADRAARAADVLYGSGGGDES